MKVLCDYFVFSMKIHCIQLLTYTLHIPVDKCSLIKSFYGYDTCYYYEGVKIHVKYSDETKVNLIENPESDIPEYAYIHTIESVILDCSGKGCRTVEYLNPGFDWFEFLYKYHDLIIVRDAHIARMDIAIDDTDGYLNMQTLFDYTAAGQYVCKSKGLPRWMQGAEEFVYFGSATSDRRLRIYNKALEQKKTDQHWIRCELQLRNDNATSLYLNYAERFRGNAGLLAASELGTYLRYVNPQRAGMEALKGNRHQSRLAPVSWWSDFIGEAEKITQLYLPGYDYTFDRLSNHIHRQLGSVKTYLELTHGDVGSFLDDVDKARQNKQQEELVKMLLRADRAERDDMRG